MSKLFITSDLHFMHKRIVEFTQRGNDTTTEDHDKWLTDLWNSQVTKSDRVFHLGDFSFASKYEDVAAQVKKLNGQKFFIKGNHDRSQILDQLKKDNLIQNWKHYDEVKIAGVHTCLFHFALAVWHKQQYGSWALVGHSHGSFQPEKGKILDCGLDNSYNLYGEHKFFTEEMLEAYMQTKEVHVVDHHKVREVKEGENTNE